MHTIQTHKGELIAVEVPMDSNKYELMGFNNPEHTNLFWLKSGVKQTRQYALISDYNIENELSIIGTCTNGDLDFDAAPYVIKDGHRGYKSSTESVGGFFLARDAFKSLLTSQKIEYANTKLVFLKREK